MSKDFGETRIFQSSSGEIFQKLHEWKFVTRTDEVLCARLSYLQKSNFLTSTRNIVALLLL